METDPTRRFSSRVEDYIQYRPSYPEAILALLVRECGLRPGTKVADIGSGTGMLAALFLRLGCEVWGVEPNREMRAAGERLLADFPRFHSRDGRAEDTGLSGRGVELVAAGQSFHWFDQERARSEFRRILRPPGWVVLIWNERLVTGSFLEQYEKLLLRYSPEYEHVDHRRVGSADMDRLMGENAWRVASFPNEQRLDLEGLLGRLRSSSYAPQPGSAAYDEMNRDMTRLFAQSEREGVVVLRYETKVYYGVIGAGPGRNALQPDPAPGT